MSQPPPRYVAGRYLLISELGRGAMGRVWAARDQVLNRDVALKELVLPTGLTEAERHDLRERAVREARAVARLNHPNVVRIFDVVSDGGEPWLVMELVRSRSLQDLLEYEGPMAPDRAARIGLSVLAALRSAHAAGMLHRDVKPANVLIGGDGRVVLTDFGIAVAPGDSSMTRTGIVLGSPSYLAPERALDAGVGPAADLWSLGATLYAAVEGTPPYARSTPMATLAALATEPPGPPRRAGALGPALAGLLTKDPVRRADAETAERLLRRAAAGLGPAAPAPAEAPAGGSRGRRPGLIWVGAVLAVVAVLVATPIVRRALAGDGTRTAVLSPTAAAPRESPSRPVTRPRGVAPKPTGTTATPSRSVAPASSPPATTATPGPAPATTTATAAATGRTFVNSMSGTCLDVPDGAATADLQLWDCFGAGNQRFTLAGDGTVRVLGRCLQLRGTGNGAHLGIAACTGSRSQRFRYNGSFDLVSVQVDRCVDVPDGDSSNGVPAQIWDCTGAENQKWRYA